jgi:hypothetical protein
MKFEPGQGPICRPSDHRAFARRALLAACLALLGSAPRAYANAPADTAQPARAGAPVEVVDGPRQGQAGYVHFFLLETPEHEGEIQVGIELSDGRIGWSFPEVGSGIMPFIRSGSVEVNGRIYGVEHLYGLRPFPDEASMSALRAALWDRVSPLVEGKTPY